MDVLGEILDWSAKQPPWQRDALRRLFTAGALTASDLDDLLQLAKAKHGLGKPRSPQPLAKEHLGIKESGTDPVSLVSVTHLAGVNALAPNQTIAFGPNHRLWRECSREIRLHAHPQACVSLTLYRGRSCQRPRPGRQFVIVSAALPRRGRMDGRWCPDRGTRRRQRL